MENNNTKRVEVGTSPATRIQIRCTDCGGFVFADEGGTIRHSRRCDHRDDGTYFPAEGKDAAAPADYLPGKRSASEWRAIRAAARQGAVSAVLTDDEIVDAVANGQITVSDAMNRDF